MQKYLENRERQQIVYDQYSRTGVNRRLKFFAYLSIGICLLLLIIQFIMLIKNYGVLDRAFLILRGCAGIFACISVILFSILLYRVFNAYWADRNLKR